ncbi:hypothetical protein X975_07831, partial [Stegodyphus mimosarum]
MNSGNNRISKTDNSLLQSFSVDNDNRRDIFRSREENERFRPQPRPLPETSPPVRTSTTIKTSSTTTTAAPLTLSPKEATDVNAILSKLISASGAASGGSGPRFVVVAPLPDNADVLQGQGSPSSGIARVDHSGKVHSTDNNWSVSGKTLHESDLVASGSSQNYQKVPPPIHRSTNNASVTDRIGFTNGESSATRRIGDKTFVMNTNGNNHRGGGFNSPPLELTGFEPFDSMMQLDSLTGSASSPKVLHNPPRNFNLQHKRGPPQGIYGTRNHLKPLQDQHIFTPHGLKANSPPGMIASHQPGIGLKPIQQQLHHMDNAGPPLRPEESNRWGTLSFPPSPPYVHKPPEGISLSISSPANSGTHVSSEPVNVIKSFFLPFLPKPRLNMNARVVFGVVLDKGVGVGGKKDAGHHPF